jgi:hypothetical protein
MKRRATVCASALGTALAIDAAHADTVVQIPLPDVLDARSVTTLTDGQLVVFDLPTDGGNLMNAYATKAVAEMQGQPPANALPNDGVFPADARHPEVVLNFSNDAPATSPQTFLVAALTPFSFPVPMATYSKLFLFFNGAAGGTTIHVTLTYGDATTQVEDAMVPDYYADISPTDPVIFNLASDLAKWDMNTQINEANHHNLTGVELNPNATAVLTEVEVEREADGNLVFWGATGIATSDIAGAGAGGAGGMAGGAGTAGAAGTAGLAGSAGSGGTAAGSAGMPTSAGAAGASAGAGGSPGPTAGAAGTAIAAGGTAGTPATAGAPSSSQPAAPSSSGCALNTSHTLHPGFGLLLGVFGIAQARRASRRNSRHTSARH